MNRYIKLLVVLSIIFYSGCGSNRDLSTALNPSDTVSSRGIIVRVLAFSSQDTRAAYGILLSTGELLTSKHVVFDADLIYAQLPDGEYKKFSSADSILHYGDSSLVQSGIVDSRIIGQVSVGIPGINTSGAEYIYLGSSSPFAISPGDIVSFPESNLVAVPISTRHGDSGGVLVTKDGDMVGVLVGRVGGLTLFHDLKKGGKFNRPTSVRTLGSNNETIAHAIQSHGDDFVETEIGTIANSVHACVQFNNAIRDAALGGDSRAGIVAALSELRMSGAQFSEMIWPALIPENAPVNELLDCLIVQDNRGEASSLAIEQTIVLLAGQGLLNDLHEYLDILETTSVELPCQAKHRIAVRMTRTLSADQIQSEASVVAPQWKSMFDLARVITGINADSYLYYETGVVDGCIGSKDTVELLLVLAMNSLKINQERSGLDALLSTSHLDRCDNKSIFYGAWVWSGKEFDEIVNWVDDFDGQPCQSDAVVSMATALQKAGDQNKLGLYADYVKKKYSEEMRVRVQSRLDEFDKSDEEIVAYLIGHLRESPDSVGLVEDLSKKIPEPQDLVSAAEFLVDILSEKNYIDFMLDSLLESNYGPGWELD